MSAPSKWNFWNRYDSVLYEITAHHPTKSWREITAYDGKTIQRPWTDRIQQHLWGGGRYGSTAQPWADTVLGWRPDGTVHDVIKAGGVRIYWRGRVSPFGLWWREIALIWWRRPRYNSQWNKHNPRRISSTTARAQRARRDLGMVASGPMVSPVVWERARWIAVLLTVLIAVVLFFPGMPGADAALVGWDWVLDNRMALAGWAVLGVGGVAYVGRTLKHRTRRRRSRRKAKRWR